MTTPKCEVDALTSEDVPGCATLLMKVYNEHPWNFRWTEEAARRYILELFENERFVGYKLRAGDVIVGAVLCHEKTWWTDDELVIDELYVDPQFRNLGCGALLVGEVEARIKERKLAGFTLLTDRNMPCVRFYERQGASHNDAVIMMYKIVGA